MLGRHREESFDIFVVVRKEEETMGDVCANTGLFEACKLLAKDVLYFNPEKILNE